MTETTAAADAPVILTSILNYRTPEMTLRAIGAARTAMAGLGGEIVVVDNDSGDGSFAWLRERVAEKGWDGGAPGEGGAPPVRVVASPRNGGFGAGHNFAMATGLSDGRRPDYVYLLNSDAFPAPEALRLLRDAMEADPSLGLAGSYIHGPDGAAHCTSFRFPSVFGEFEGAVRLGPVTRLLRRWVVPMPIPEGTAEVDWTAGASLMMRQDMLEAVGGFDETFFLYYEETDLCLRARRAGWGVAYVRASEVEHIGSASTGMKGWDRIPGYFLDSRLHYFVKNHGTAYAAAATLAHAAGAALDGLRGLVSARPVHIAKGYTRDMLAHHSRAALRALGRRVGIGPRARGGVPAAPR